MNYLVITFIQSLSTVFFIIVLIGFLSGLVKGISGFGSSLVALPLLVFVLGQNAMTQIVVALVTFNLLLNSLLLREHRGLSLYIWKQYWMIPFFGIIFTIIAANALYKIPTDIIRYAAFLFLIMAIVSRLFPLHLPLKDNNITKSIVGILSGIGNGLASIDGPPVVAYLTTIKADQATFKVVLAFHFLTMGLFAALIHFLKGAYQQDMILLYTSLSLGSLCGILVGLKIARHLNQKTFDRIVLVLLLLLSISLII